MSAESQSIPDLNVPGNNLLLILKGLRYMENTLTHRLLTPLEHDWVVKDICERGNVRKALVQVGMVDEEDLKVPVRYELYTLQSMIATQELTDIIMTVVDRLEDKQIRLHINMKLLGSGSFPVRTSILE